MMLLMGLSRCKKEVIEEADTVRWMDVLRYDASGQLMSFTSMFHTLGSSSPD